MRKIRCFTHQVVCVCIYVFKSQTFFIFISPVFTTLNDFTLPEIGLATMFYNFYFFFMKSSQSNRNTKIKYIKNRTEFYKFLDLTLLFYIKQSNLKSIAQSLTWQIYAVIKSKPFLEQHLQFYFYLPGTHAPKHAVQHSFHIGLEPAALYVDAILLVLEQSVQGCNALKCAV